MKNLLIVLLLSFVAQAQAQSRVKEVNVCGDFNVSSDGRHFLKVNSGDLQNGLYEIFATN